MSLPPFLQHYTDRLLAAVHDDDDDLAAISNDMKDTTTTTTITEATADMEVVKSALDVFSVVMSNLLLFFLIFGLSATVDVRHLRRQLRNKFAIGTGVAMQFLVMPLLGFSAVLALRDHGLTQAMGLTLLVVTSSPGGSYSNWWCSTFNADLALSVTMTSISSLLSVAMLPANLFLYTYLAYGVLGDDEDGHKEENILQALDFKSIFITLGVVMAAIGMGLLAGWRYDYPAFHIYANRFGTVCGVLLILFSVFLSSGLSGGTGDDDSSSNFWSHPPAFYIGTALPCVAGIAVANVLSRSLFRLSKPECVTISIECCYQNVGIATSVAVTMFQDPVERSQAVSVPLFYGLVEAFIIAIYCVWAWKAGWTKAPPEEHICVVVSKTYEVEDDDHVMDGMSDEDRKCDNKCDCQGPQQQDENAADCGTVDKYTPCCSGGKGSAANRSRLVSEDNTASTSSTSVTFASPATQGKGNNRMACYSGSPVNRDLLPSFASSIVSMEEGHTFATTNDDGIHDSTNNVPSTVLTTQDEEGGLIMSPSHLEDLTETVEDDDEDDDNDDEEVEGVQLQYIDQSVER